MRIENDIKLDYSDVLIRPKRSTMVSRSQVDLNRKYTFRNYVSDHEHVHYYGTPIMAANMDGVGTFGMAIELSKMGMFTCLVKTYSVEDLVHFFNRDDYDITANVAMSIGTSDNDIKKFFDVYEQTSKRLKYLCVDVANGYTEHFVDKIRKIRNYCKEVVIIAGNVVTGEMTEELILSGADIVKVGIGPGSVCTTRIQTGVGFPQLSAVIECADAAHGIGGHIIADGGCSTAGDVAKAFGAGADFVMLGGMLAGTDQGGGEVITKFYQTNEYYEDEKGNSQYVNQMKSFVKFYGMSSETANDKHFGGLKDYRASEGRTVLTEYKGDIKPVVQDILGGIRSTCTYVGAETLKQLSKCTTFIRCNNTHNRVFEGKTIGK